MTRRWWLWGCIISSAVAIALVAWAFHVYVYNVRHEIGINLSHPTWTSDGKEIVFEREYVDTEIIWLLMGFHSTTKANYSVMKVAADGGKPKVLVENAWNCGCSPKLPLVAYVTGKPGFSGKDDELWILDLRTGKKWMLASNENKGTHEMTWYWSPSTDQILYCTQDMPCCVGDPWGKDRVDVYAKLRLSSESRIKSFIPYWSRDGFIYLQVDFFGSDGTEQHKGYKIAPGTWQVTETKAGEESHAELLDLAEAWKLPPPPSDGIPSEYLHYCGLSPDGKKIAFSPKRHSASAYGPKMVVRDRATGEEKVIVDYSREERE